MLHSYSENLKQQVINLRRQGYSYSEIQGLVGIQIPKGTLSGWLQSVKLSAAAKKRILNKIREAGLRGLPIAWQSIQSKRSNMLSSIRCRVETDITYLDKNMTRLALAMLYLGDGGKYGELFRFSNSDPQIIELFMVLLRKSYPIDEPRLRGKVQCRADQSIEDLEKFWSGLTSIPLNQFHKAQIDKRTIGIPTGRANYKGVFVIMYCSKELFFEVKFLSDIIYERIVQKGR